MASADGAPAPKPAPTESFTAAAAPAPAADATPINDAHLALVKRFASLLAQVSADGVFDPQKANITREGFSELEGQLSELLQKGSTKEIAALYDSSVFQEIANEADRYRPHTDSGSVKGSLPEKIEPRVDQEFDAGGHMAIATMVSLRAANGRQFPASVYPLTDTGLTLVDVVALAGDYFADAKDAISDHQTLTAKHAALVAKLCDPTALPAAIVEKIHELFIQWSAANSKLTDHEFERQLAQLACGYWKGNYEVIKMAANNPDHFGDDAERAFSIMHRRAIELAIAAHQEGTMLAKGKKLREAYVYAGFGAHFLTDRFASGHMRVPRRELHALGRAGDLLVHIMHDEDNERGLAVRARGVNGAPWRSYGDGKSREPGNALVNLQMAASALQRAMDEVHQAYLTGVAPYQNHASSALAFIPVPLPFPQNDAPLVMLRTNAAGQRELTVRQPLNDVRATEYAPLDTSSWRLRGLLVKHTLQQLPGLIRGFIPFAAPW